MTSGSAGDYDRKLTWQRRLLTKDTTTGQDVETFVVNGKLWASVNYISGQDTTAYGSDQSGSTVEIRLRNYPSVGSRDRLYSAQWGERYIVDSVRRGDNEIIVDAHLWDELELP